VGALPHASVVQNVRLNATVIVPNALQGIFRRRREAVRAATVANVDSQAVGLLVGMSRSNGGLPTWVKVVRDDAILLFDPKDVERLLNQSPDPFASDPAAKRDGMVHFQPDALTISRGQDWTSRRRFTEAVLGHAPAERAGAVAAEETARLLGTGSKIGWAEWNRTLQRTTRRIVLGDSAAEDDELTETLERMMSGANGMPGKPSEELGGFVRKLSGYVESAEDGSLAGLLKGAPADERTAPVGQLTHWLFAMGDTLAINSFRALALLASFQAERDRALADESGAYLDACLHEAMRLWPTTTMLSRVSTAPSNWHSERVPEGTQFLILNTYGHRDPDRLAFADRFAPEEWTLRDAASNPAFNHFSRGPQGCPGTALALLVGRTALRAVLERGVRRAEPGLNAAKPLPHMLDFFSLRVFLAD